MNPKVQRLPKARCPLTPTCSLTRVCVRVCVFVRVCVCVCSGELLRKKRREKDGHKDPLLCEISGLQESVMRQISELRLEHEAAERKRTEIDKVALILGLDPSDRPRRAPAADKTGPEGGPADKVRSSGQ